MNRRHFLQAATAAAAFVPIASRAADSEFADVKKRIALIGAGWYGKCDL
ncbi:MAG: twin-arginine translocation signal domain-containing protein, partial [Verrucomicrobia bacterium]|nr:twin-arginine translocation signal domain-containing protein [Verrucomicrobiota bacterium]